MSHAPNSAALAINWQIYGSNGHEIADLSRGVLERFTRRAPVDWTSNGLGNNHVKTIANPRAINFVAHPHYLTYFEGLHAVNENGKRVPSWSNNPVTVEKNAVNHYYTKSREEFTKAKMLRGWACENKNPYDMKSFDNYNRNDEFDDEILRYRAERAKTFQLPDKSRTDERLLNALTLNLSPTLFANTPPNFYAGKMETFLTCRAVAEYLKPKLADDALAKFFEEASLKAILKSFNGLNFVDARLFLRELPKILNSSCSAVDELRAAALEMLDQLKSFMRLNVMWKDFVQLDYIRDILKLGG